MQDNNLPKLLFVNRMIYYPEKTPGSAGGLAAFDSSVVK